ncbi:acylneuraminate cytidylyltransferase [Mycolicibacterium vinylchloridicum]|uniref:acylneuraminate cytidylyltransferase n=1 Tax=Mycolicibacterium vinylchloridicum TaxID=2736928 RepID=UPI0015CE30CF|nr:acylneuraminate cytidylyltransferase [Mycolicibacterium vinylchloridicum]
MPEVLAVIPARGGSKSLPRKNVRPLGGIPLIAHTIRAAQAADLVTRVVVSTEDAEIASIARSFGADVIDRPVELASDEASSESALLHALDYLDTAEGYRPDILCFLQCTSPLTASEDIDNVLSTMIEAGAETALAVTRFHYFVWRQDHEGSAVGVNHDKAVRLRRQDRHREFLETGAVYAMLADGFRVARHRFFGRTVVHEMPASRVLEIDDPEDFVLATQRLDADRMRAPILPSPVHGIAFDFDGVFTDDLVSVDEHGTESVRCSRRDGMGIEMLRAAGIPMVVISKERNPVVARRCEKLRLEYRQGQDDKRGVLKLWLEESKLDAQHVIYVGNDVNDLECMAAVGCAVAPADAHPHALAAASVVLRSGGGRGAIRELADMILGGAA